MIPSTNSETDALLLAACACTDELRSLLHGEESAVQTYRQAMERGGFDSVTLAPLLREHRESANDLRRRLRSLGGDPVVAPLVWEEFAAASEGTSSRSGNAAALASLRRGEELGRLRYEDALATSKLDASSKDAVRTTLLPRQLLHVAALEALVPLR